jgi:hypothetical protein
MITGLPHSEIPGSKCMCHSPRLIAACHVLHRLVSPRHSPTALVNLVFSINPKSPISILTLIYHPEMTFIISDVSFFKTLNFQRTYEVLSHLRKLFLFKIRCFSKLVYHHLVEWWAQVDLNHRPHAYQACALTN